MSIITKNLANYIARFLEFLTCFCFFQSKRFLSVCSACDGDVKELDRVRTFVVCRDESVL